MTLLNSPKIYVGPSFLSDFSEAIRSEWIVANGLGGYASSTVLNINTRKYHGLLVVAFNPPVERRLLLAKVDEEAWIGNNLYSFYSNEFRDAIFPDGYKRLIASTFLTVCAAYWEDSKIQRIPSSTMMLELEGFTILDLLFSASPPGNIDSYPHFGGC